MWDVNLLASAASHRPTGWTWRALRHTHLQPVRLIQVAESRSALLAAQMDSDVSVEVSVETHSLHLLGGYYTVRLICEAGTTQSTVALFDLLLLIFNRCVSLMHVLGIKYTGSRP